MSKNEKKLETQLSFPLTLENVRLAIVGLGYVGLPLAVEFSKKFSTVGFDVDEERINQLKNGFDRTNEVTSSALIDAKDLSLVSDIQRLVCANVFIITVPTPVDRNKRPDLSHLKNASKTVGQVITRGSVVIFESTVFPGATEEVCVPILEKVSGLKFNEEFFVGYSPERVNPGDQARTIPNIVKITSGSTPDAAEFINKLYERIIEAGTFLAQSIQIAEAAKVIENTQRDVNIALMNELAMLFDRMGIDTGEVLKAANTKWNFINFSPGLVGGHCIGVDPYYLTHKAKAVDYHPEIILAGRRINDNMSSYISSTLVKAILRKFGSIEKKRVLVLGLTFKENCPDIRNSKVFDVVKDLEGFGLGVDVYDPWVDVKVSGLSSGTKLCTKPKKETYDAILIAVAHSYFLQMGIKSIKSFGKSGAITYDLKHMFEKDECDLRL